MMVGCLGEGCVDRPKTFVMKELHCGVQLEVWTTETCALGNFQLSNEQIEFVHVHCTFFLHTKSISSPIQSLSYKISTEGPSYS